jgi:RNA polymerase subunit RPABC4/transcription elongation factor Spt4
MSMPWRFCNMCKAKIRHDAKICPHCRSQKKSSAGTVVVVIIIIIAALYFFGDSIL